MQGFSRSMQNEESWVAFPFHQAHCVGLTADVASHDDWGGKLLFMDNSPRSHCEVLTSLMRPPFQEAILGLGQPRQSILETVDQASGTLYPHPLTIEPPLTDILSLPSPSRDCVESTGLTGIRLTASENNNTSSDHHRVLNDTRYPGDHLVWHCNRRGPRLPAADYESNVTNLQERLKREGANPDAVDLVQKIFCNGVTLDALTRRRTREEATQGAFGRGAGPVYLAFLDTVKSTQCENGSRYRCRLCPNKGELLTWKYHRDVLRHLRKEHFGLGNECPHWYVGSPLCNLQPLTVC